jgi:hypothetical protein
MVVEIEPLEPDAVSSEDLGSDIADLVSVVGVVTIQWGPDTDFDCKGTRLRYCQLCQISPNLAMGFRR